MYLQKHNDRNQLKKKCNFREIYFLNKLEDDQQKLPEIIFEDYLFNH